MKRSQRIASGVALGLLLAGCQVPYWMRVPALAPNHPELERESYIDHDPLPDSLGGPDISGRPREAQIQRSMPRQTLEKSQPGYSVERYNGGAPSTAYPGVVNP